MDFLLRSVIAGLMAAFLHEVGHFIVARLLVRLPVHRLTFGMGKQLLAFKLKETEIEFCVFPFGGQIYILPEHIKNLARHKIALVSAGGFLTNIMLAISASWFWSHPLAKLFLILNVIVAISCLLPDRGKSDGERMLAFLTGREVFLKADRENADINKAVLASIQAKFTD